MNSLIEAFLLGLAGGAIPGPILTGTFTEILNGSFLRGCKVVFWALITETAGALLALYILYSLGLSDLVIKIISIGGAMVLFWLASQVWTIDTIGVKDKQFLTFPKVALLTALNSGYWIFWITVGIPKAILFDQQILGGKFLFLFVFELAWLIITLALAFIFFKFRTLLEKKNLVGTTFKILALILVVLSIKTLLNIF